MSPEHLPLNILGSFVAFNQAKNIMEAADRLGITQPALSKHLMQVEQAFPEPVFVMRGRKKVLTPFGEELYRRLAERIGGIQEAIQQARELYARGTAATLRIAGRRGVLDRIAAKLEFEGALHFQERSNAETIQLVMDMSAELGIAHSFPVSHELIAKPLFKEQFQLVIPKRLLPIEKPAFGKALMAELARHACLGYKVDDEIIRAVFDHVGAGTERVRLTRVTENYESLAEMVRATRGWSILPSYLEISESQNWLLPIPEKVIPHRQFYLVYRPEFANVSWFKKLLSEIRGCF